MEILGIPDWGLRLIFVILLVGFPIALIFSWVCEVTPEGIRREADVGQELQATTTRRLDIAVIAVVVLAAGLFGAKWFAEDDTGSATPPPR